MNSINDIAAAICVLCALANVVVMVRSFRRVR